MGSLLANANLVKKVWFPRRAARGLHRRRASGCRSSSSWACSRVALLIAGNMVLPWILPVLVRGAHPGRLRARARAGAVRVDGLLPRPRVPRGDRAAALVLRHARSCTRCRLVEDALGDRPGLLTLYELNPMTRFVEVYRDLFYSLRWPDARRRGLPRGLRGRLAGHRAGRPSAGSRAAWRRSCDEPAITVEHLSKRFRLYHDRNQSLKAAVMRGRRAQLRGVLGPARRLPRDRRGRHLRLHRHQRLGQEHAAEVPGPDPRARRGQLPHARQGVGAARARAPASTRSCPGGRTSTSTARSSGCRRPSSTAASTTSSSSPGSSGSSTPR